MSTAVAVTAPLPTCQRCEGRGVRFDREIQIARGGQLQLCTCAVEDCQCHGQAPHMYWGEDSHRQWCPCVGPRRRLRHLEHLFKHAQIPSRYRFKFREDWAILAPDCTELPHAKKTRALLPALIDAGVEPDQGVVLHGPPGPARRCSLAFCSTSSCLPDRERHASSPWAGATSSDCGTPSLRAAIATGRARRSSTSCAGSPTWFSTTLGSSAVRTGRRLVRINPNVA